MIREVNTTPLAFEQIVAEEMSAPLDERGFKLEPPLHLYKNQSVTFFRERYRQEERIHFQRAMYDEEFMKKGFYTGIEFDAQGNYIPLDRRTPIDDEVDGALILSDGSRWWVSRHRLFVTFVAEYGSMDMRTDGEVKGTEIGKDNDWWYFADEDNLRRRLQDVLPFILTKGERWFDDRLTDVTGEDRRKRKQVEQENIAQALKETEEVDTITSKG